MIFKLAWKNTIQNKWSTFLSCLLISISVILLLFINFTKEHLKKQINSNLDDIDMVLGASGSPLQLILSSVYHIDNPTGNIDYEFAKKIMNHPYIEKAIPLAYGDSYKGIRIVGTNYDFIKHYDAQIDNGRIFKTKYEVIIGSTVSKKENLKIGDHFYSRHGLDDNGEIHKNKPYKIVGILKPTTKIIDKLIISN